MTRQPVDVGLDHVSDHGEAAHEIAVERRVANRELALVARGQYDAALEVSDRHEQRASDPRLDVLLREPVALARAEESRELLQEVLVDRLDRNRVRADAQPANQLLGIAHAVLRGEGARHQDAGDVLGSERPLGEVRRHGRVDPARESHDGRVEPELVQVVSHAENESALQELDVVLDRLRLGSSGREGIDDREVLAEARQSLDNGSGRVDHEAGAVEDQLVVSADEVDEDEGHAVATGRVDDHGLAKRDLVLLPRRRRDREDQLGPLPHQLLDRVDRVRPALAPELPAPDVLADGQADATAAEGEDAPLISRAEVARLVEDVVGR